MTYTIQKFNPISLEQYLAVFGSLETLDESQHIQAYQLWLNDFLQKLGLFYFSQYDRHRRQVSGLFYATIEKEPGDYLSESEQQLLEEISLQEGLNDHYDFEMMHSERIRRAQKNIENYLFPHHPTGNSSPISTGADWFHLRWKLQELGAPNRRNIDEFWFNNLPDVPILDGRVHFDMSYTEYLRSPRWNYFRNAMLMIYRATCQEQTCARQGENYYMGGWETDMHVHHLTYEHVGQERYRDLTLLCNRHHELWHQLDREGKPNLIIDEL